MIQRFDRKWDATRVFLWMSFGESLCSALFYTLFIIYQVNVVGLSPLQVVLAGTVMEAACFLFEIPTGVVADLFSRRLSIIIGFGIMASSYVLQGAVPQVWAVMLSGVLWGLGYTFTSGANQAWITDEIGEDAVGPVFLRRTRAELTGAIVGTLMAVGLGLIALAVPMVTAGVLLAVITLWLILVMPERYRPARERVRGETWQDFARLLRDGFREAMNRPVARVLVIISLVTGIASELVDRLSIPFMLDRFEFPTIFGTNDPVIWFGMSSLVGLVIGIVITTISERPRYESRISARPAGVLSALAAVHVLAVAGFALSNTIWVAFGMLWMRQVAVALISPIEAAWLNRNVESATRATVLSMVGQSRALGEIAGGPPMGALANRIGIKRALLVSAGILLPLVPLYGSQESFGRVSREE